MQVMGLELSQRANAAVRRCKGRGRHVRGHPSTASEMDYSDREWEFMLAIQEYKLKNGKQFPTWSEALTVIDGLGYKLPPRPPPADLPSYDEAA